MRKKKKPSVDAMIKDPAMALGFYKGLIEENEDGAIPMLAYCTSDDEVTLIALAGNLPGTMQDVLHTVTTGMRQKIGAPKWIVFSCESWFQTFKPADTPPKLKPGELQERAEAGEQVSECAMIVGIGWTEEWMTMAPFERKDGKVIWGEEVEQKVVRGGVADILRTAVTGG